MNGYTSYPERPFPQHNNSQNMMNMAGEGMGFGTPMDDGQSLNDIVSLNEKANRRRSMPVYPNQPDAMQMGSPDSRRLSMMNFGDGSAGAFEDFQFSMPADATMDGMMRGATFPRTTSEMQNDHRPTADLAISTQFSNQNSPFPHMQGPGSAYASPLHHNLSLDAMDMNSPYPTAIDMSLDMGDPSLAMMGTDMNLISARQFSNSMMGSPVAQDFNVPLPGPRPDPSSLTPLPHTDQFNASPMGGTPDLRANLPSRPNSQEQSSGRSSAQPLSEQQPSSQSTPHVHPTTSIHPQERPTPIRLPKQEPSQEIYNGIKLPWTAPPGGFPSTMTSNPHMKTQFKNVYSSTGFDMLGVLMRVATRQNPQIDIGSVDLSCAFVVCDAAMDDNPIVYCSENFERLTGYSKHMILGRNCRFLQSPDGKVEPGVKRNYVDDDAVLYLKNMITTRQEAQISLINYRRGGQPFMNLLTMIPISWEAGGPIKFIVGFQVDLVEQPGSMTNKNADGSYRVNYQRGMSMPSYIFDPDAHKPHSDAGQTVSKDEVSNVLTTYGAAGESDITRRVWDKVLLENTDDVVHVLSLKGLFLYLSPSSIRILEYDPSELVGTALSSVCHPSDIVPVTRELKEATNGTSVNVVFRIRRKKSGYMWFEGHGSLHNEQGKGRKCIILVGRERPVYTLSKSIVRASGGIGDNELWTKMSTSGMFLFVSSNVRQLLDRQPEELVGSSMQALMRAESKQNFGRILELARTGRKAEVKHEMINKRGQVLQAFTTIYPGDATEGQKPTFIVGQTRMLRHTRSAAQRPSMYTSKERTGGDSLTPAQSVPSGTSPAQGGATPGMGSSTPHTSSSGQQFQSTEVSATTMPGQQGLALGHQDQFLASDDNVFDELKTTRSTSWQYELRQMEKRNRYLAEEVQSLLAAKKKRKRRKGAGQLQKDCANCHTRTTPEWRRGPSGNRDLCNSCGLRWAKQNGRVSPRNSSQHSQSDKSKKSVSPRHPSMLSNPIQESEAQPSIGATLAHGEKRTPQQTSSDSHAAKIARMEGSAPQGYGGGVPAKIEEAVEPPD
ncbi:white collar-1 transcript variant 2 [Aaosphaeria arxii CBS 175.79]|uniref:White collar-1 transcript variant 2 n=1 Tax=Aaosphaeria arxii CBS 175.79 TaxID=1450172 RepID=A0A6A5XZ81_9PLEO|nr:white collar-1 transcript variant 2 [Aaosphaeria arxii CBS 175.79]KAF2018492.1 white collar-1 transcript variant 2 [Aaosphaeria arxii CBS 175.79]